MAKTGGKSQNKDGCSALPSLYSVIVIVIDHVSCLIHDVFRVWEMDSLPCQQGR